MIEGLRYSQATGNYTLIGAAGNSAPVRWWRALVHMHTSSVAGSPCVHVHQQVGGGRLWASAHWQGKAMGGYALAGVKNIVVLRQDLPVKELWQWLLAS